MQQRATKLLGNISDLSYEDHLRTLDLYTLYCRRIRGNLIHTFKVLNFFTATRPDALFTLTPEYRTRGHCLKLYKPRRRLRVAQKFFACRVITNWNNLSQCVVAATSVTNF